VRTLWTPPRLGGYADRRADLAWRAIPALEAVMFDERPLKRVKPVLRLLAPSVALAIGVAECDGE
jgi:hypothetical protein